MNVVDKELYNFILPVDKITMRNIQKIIEKITEKTALSTLLCYLFSILFWYVWLVKVSYDVLDIGLGLGGALYPVFFSLPVVLGCLVYQFILRKNRDMTAWGLKKKFMWTCLVPMIFVAFGMMVFCPTDTPHSYLVSLWTALIGS